MKSEYLGIKVLQLNKTFILIALSIVIVYGCTVSTGLTFERGVKKLNEFDKSYGATLKSPPNTSIEIDELLSQIVWFRAVNEMPESLEYLVDFKIKFL